MEEAEAGVVAPLRLETLLGREEGRLDSLMRSAWAVDSPLEAVGPTLRPSKLAVREREWVPVWLDGERMPCVCPLELPGEEGASAGLPAS